MSWKLGEDGFSVGCIFYPSIPQLCIRYVQQTLQRNNRTSRCIKKLVLQDCVDFDGIQTQTESFDKPLDRNIHFLVSSCTAASRSVSATRRWSDYSCLYIRIEKFLITYLSKYYYACFYSFPCRKACGKTNEGFVWHQLPFRKQSTRHTYGLKRWIITLTCLKERSTLGDNFKLVFHVKSLIRFFLF